MSLAAINLGFWAFQRHKNKEQQCRWIVIGSVLGLHGKSLKEGRNYGFDPSLGENK